MAAHSGIGRCISSSARLQRTSPLAVATTADQVACYRHPCVPNQVVLQSRPLAKPTLHTLSSSSVLDLAWHGDDESTAHCGSGQPASRLPSHSACRTPSPRGRWHGTYGVRDTWALSRCLPRALDRSVYLPCCPPSDTRTHNRPLQAPRFPLLPPFHPIPSASHHRHSLPQPSLPSPTHLSPVPPSCPLLPTISLPSSPSSPSDPLLLRPYPSSTPLEAKPSFFSSLLLPLVVSATGR